MVKTILIVDDDQSILDMTALVLNKHGFDVMTAMNGLEGLARIREATPDLILADVVMPEMDGYAFYKELKKDPQNSNIPVLIITARGKMEDSFKVMGVDGFITKPILPEDLLVEIENIQKIVETRQALKPRRRDQIPKKVLLISPDRTLLDNMAFQAERLGCKVSKSYSGSDAITQVVRFIPDIIFIDVMMRDMTAAELISIFRRLPQFEAKPLVGFCYYPTETLGDDKMRPQILGIQEASQRALQCGATTYMGRYHGQVFIQTIREQLKEADGPAPGNRV